MEDTKDHIIHRHRGSDEHSSTTTHQRRFIESNEDAAVLVEETQPPVQLLRQKCFQFQMGRGPGTRHQLCDHGNSEAAARSPHPTRHMCHHRWRGSLHHISYIWSAALKPWPAGATTRCSRQLRKQSPPQEENHPFSKVWRALNPLPQ